MNTNEASKSCRFQLAGWILFIFSALFFIATSVRAGDMLGLAGGLFFLFACIVFLIPLIFSKHTNTDPEEPNRS
jgi:energy-coupling factor transporter transmembrane protein EcfT